MFKIFLLNSFCISKADSGRSLKLDLRKGVKDYTLIAETIFKTKNVRCKCNAFFIFIKSTKVFMSFLLTLKCKFLHHVTKKKKVSLMFLNLF